MKPSVKYTFCFILAALFAATVEAQATSYLPGTSPLLSASPAGTFDFGTHLPNYIGASNGSALEGTNLDGSRVFIFDNDSSTDNPATATPFILLVWEFTSAKDSVRLYTHQDHYGGGGVFDSFTASEVLEYSVWGCNGATVGGCTSQADWTLLSDPTGFTDLASGNPVYTFAGTDPTTIFRNGSAEFGITNAYVQDFTFGTAYNYYAIRGSTIAMVADTADPELDALVAFNRVDFQDPGCSQTNTCGGAVPEPSTVILFGSGMAGLILWRLRLLPAFVVRKQ